MANAPGEIENLRRIISKEQNDSGKKQNNQMKISSQTGNNWSPKSKNETEPTAQISEETPERMHPSVSLEGAVLFCSFAYCAFFVLFYFFLPIES